MAVVQYQQRNSQNLQALIEFMLSKGSNQLPIEYMQLGGMVLLGKDHNSNDVNRIETAVGDWKHKGRIGVRVDQDQKKLIMLVEPTGTQTGDRLQLEDAVRAAVQGMTLQPYKSWAVEFRWP